MNKYKDFDLVLLKNGHLVEYINDFGLNTFSYLTYDGQTRKESIDNIVGMIGLKKGTRLFHDTLNQEVGVIEHIRSVSDNIVVLTNGMRLYKNAISVLRVINEEGVNDVNDDAVVKLWDSDFVTTPCDVILKLVQNMNFHYEENEECWTVWDASNCEKYYANDCEKYDPKIGQLLLDIEDGNEYKIIQVSGANRLLVKCMTAEISTLHSNTSTINLNDVSGRYRLIKFNHDQEVIYPNNVIYFVRNIADFNDYNDYEDTAIATFEGEDLYPYHCKEFELQYDMKVEYKGAVYKITDIRADIYESQTVECFTLTSESGGSKLVWSRNIEFGDLKLINDNKQLTIKKEEKVTKTLTTSMIDSNKSAAITAAKIKSGKLALSAARKAIRPKVPALVRGYFDEPYTDLLLANVLATLVKAKFPENKRLNTLADCCMEAAAVNIADSFDIESLVEGLFSGVKLSKELTAEE